MLPSFLRHFLFFSFVASPDILRFLPLGFLLLLPSFRLQHVSLLASCQFLLRLLFPVRCFAATPFRRAYAIFSAVLRHAGFFF